MKTNIFIYTCCVVAGALLASCSNDDEPLSYGEYPLQIESATVAHDGAASRVAETADGTGSQWSDGDKISVRIGDDGKTGTYTLNADGSVKTADTPVYWQSKAAQTVTAWYPSSDGAIDLSDQTAGLKYVLKATAEDKTFSDAVSLGFKHQLAKIRVKLSGNNTSGVTAVAVKGMTSFSTEQGKVGAATNEGYIKMMKATYTDGEYYEANLTPQTINADDFVEITADGKMYICKMNCNITAIEAGNAYTFKVKVRIDGATYADSETHTIYTFNIDEVTADLVTAAIDGTGTLKIVGEISQNDLNTIINACKSSIVDLDMSEAYGTDLEIPYEAFRIGDYGSETLTSIKLPEGVTTIGEYAFFYCANLASISIPEGVTSIGISAFSGCSSLTSITIPEGVTSIGEFAFRYCSSLTSITIPEGVTSIGVDAFIGCSSLTSITIPESVTSIGDGAFSGCSSLTSITIPEGVTSIGEFAFQHCSSLTSITIPEGVTTIREYALSLCSSLTSITIPESVTTIGKRAFWGCSSLTSITIPEGVTTIGDYAFSYCI